MLYEYICKALCMQYELTSSSILVSYCDEDGTQSCTDWECFTFCSYPPAPGTCEDRVRNYFFNSERRQCEVLIYSGCGGNENRFSSNLDCLHACNPDSRSDNVHLPTVLIHDGHSLQVYAYQRDMKESNAMFQRQRI